MYLYVMLLLRGISVLIGVKLCTYFLKFIRLTGIDNPV